MAYRIAKSLAIFRDQFNKQSPHRNRSSDGWIGDAKHASRNSDHNPWVKHKGMGIVTAYDLTHDTRNGVDTWALAEHMRVQRDPRVKYVISNKRIFSSVQSPWQWRRYTGSNPHSSHMHLSVHSQAHHFDSEEPWNILVGNIPADPDDTKSRPVLKRGSQGEDVRIVQTVLGVKVDGDFGPITETAVKGFQRKEKLPKDGIVGPRTWARLDHIEQRSNGEHDGDLFEG